MAQLGFRTVAEMVGRVDRLDMRNALSHWKAKGVDLSRILYQTPVAEGEPLHNTEGQDHGLGAALDQQLIEAAAPARQNGAPVRIEREIRKVNRTVGAMLAGEGARRYGHAGRADNSRSIRDNGGAGASLGAKLDLGGRGGR